MPQHLSVATSSDFITIKIEVTSTVNVAQLQLKMGNVLNAASYIFDQ